MPFIIINKTIPSVGNVYNFFQRLKIFLINRCYMFFRKQQINFKKKNSLHCNFCQFLLPPLKKIIENYLNLAEEFAVINCLSGMCAVLQFMIQISDSRNCQQKIIYQSLNISNKRVQEIFCNYLELKAYYWKRFVFFGSLPWLPTVDKTSSLSCLKCNCDRSCCFRALTGFIYKLIFSSNALTLHLT